MRLGGRRPVSRVFVIACAVVVAGFLLSAWLTCRDLEFHADEAYWIGEGFYFSLLLDGDLDNPAWNDYWGVLNPPLVKLVYGFAQHLAGYPLRGNELVRTFGSYWSDVPELERRVPPELLRVSRFTARLFFVAAVALLFLVGARIGGAWLGLAVLALISLDRFLLDYAARAMSESIVFFLTSLFVLVSLWYFERERMAGAPRGVALPVLAVSAVIGSMALAKPSGAVAGFAFAAAAAAWYAVPAMERSGPRSGRALLLWAATVALVGSLSVVLMVGGNPHLHSDPLGSLGETLEAWGDFMAIQRTEHAGVLLEGPLQKISFFSSRGFPLEARAGTFGWAANLVLLLLGTVHIARTGLARTTRDGLLAPQLVFLAVAAVSIGVQVAWIPFAWGRYTLPVRPFVVVLQAAAPVAIASAIARNVRKRARGG